MAKTSYTIMSKKEAAKKGVSPTTKKATLSFQPKKQPKLKGKGYANIV